MKFLIMLPSTIRGGVEEYTLKLTAAAVQKGWEVHAAFPQTHKTASLIEDFQQLGVQYHRLDINEYDRNRVKRVLSYPLRFIYTLLLLLKLKPNITQIILPWLDSCLPSLVACGVLQQATAVRFGLVPPDPVPLSGWKRKLYTWARTRNQQWFAVSDNNRKLICAAFQVPPSEVLCIQNGTKVVTTPPNAADRQTVRRQVRHDLGLAETRRIAITVGRLSDQKGYSDLIPLIPRLVSEFPDLRFVWVGDGEQRDELMQQVQESGMTDYVLFLGYRSDISRLLTAADLFVFPTHYEGHPSALLEAMAHGLPIVTSDASGIPEIVEHAVHGLVIPSGDRTQLLNAVSYALHHPDAMQLMASQAQQRVGHFSEEKMCRETLELLQSLQSPPGIASAGVELSQSESAP